MSGERYTQPQPGDEEPLTLSKGLVIVGLCGYAMWFFYEALLGDPKIAGLMLIVPSLLWFAARRLVRWAGVRCDCALSEGLQYPTSAEVSRARDVAATQRNWEVWQR